MTLIGSSHLPILEEGIKTVTTAGTPVQLTTLKGKKARIQAAVENGDTIITVGDSTVDGTTSPPDGRYILYATQAIIEECHDTSLIYIDASANNGKVLYAIYG
ncbi:MAG: hypothetical protein H7831_08420 [Magnetococcus sp. WYHC-3]